MTDGTARGAEGRSARLPAALIFLTVAAVAGLALWLELAPPAPRQPKPALRVALGFPDAAVAVPMQPAEPVAETIPAPEAVAAPKPEPAPEAPAAARPPSPAPEPAALEPVPAPLQAAEPPDTGPRILPLPSVSSGPALPVAPDPGLVEPSPDGPLPIVGRDGRVPWRVYARPFDVSDKRPRISVVLYGLGMSSAATRAAIQGLPGAISLAFAPYADNLQSWIAEARAAGHEVLMMVPMEPSDFPVSDPGPRALLTSLTAKQNVSRLEWVLSRAAGYVGVTDYMGTRFTTSGGHMRSLFSALQERGLMFLASRSEAVPLARDIAAGIKLPFAASTLFIDRRASRSAIDSQLAEIERLAGITGRAIGMGFSYPVTLERLANWAQTVESRGFALAPVSAIAVQAGS